MKALVLPLFCVLVLISSSSAFAQWQFNGATVSTASAQEPKVVADGSGGVIMAWYDYRNGNADIYVQRLDASGYPQWTPNGVALCTAAGDQMYPELVSDGAGGAIVVWQDQPGIDGPIYAQRVDWSGVPQWAANGIAVCSVASYQRAQAIASDGAGGAIVAWMDYRLGNWDIYAQRVDASGTFLWGSSGLPVCTAAGTQQDCALASDGYSGAFVTWTGWGNWRDIQAQHIDASGVASWATNGITVCGSADHQDASQIVSDGLGGAIVTWMDGRAGSLGYNIGIYVQRLDPSGVALWTAGGVILSTTQYDIYPKIIRDSVHGAIITWEDGRGGIRNVYAQRVDMSGIPEWTTNGVAVTTQGGYEPELVSDGASGAIITWRQGDIYAQRLNASGVPVWVAGGVAVRTGGNNIYPSITSDDKSGAIITWQNAGGGSKAQRVESRYGSWGHPEPIITSIADVPGDNGGNVTLTWTAGDRDALNLGTITHYLIWRSTTGTLAPGTRSEGGALAQPTSWELMDSVAAIASASYSLNVATSGDSTSQGDTDHYFTVWSSTADPQVFWSSGAASGHSVDNNAPAAPLSLTAQRIGADVQLQWNPVADSDLDDYVLYRGTSSGVTPIPINYLAASTDTFYIDPSAPTSDLYYVVAARDVHENQGAASNEASVGTVTGIGNTPAITTLTVKQNYPNPFNGTTALEIGLAADGNARVDIFDVAGRKVRSIELADGRAGWQRIPITGHDARGRPMPSGVYLYRVSANGQTVTGKMVLTR